MICRGQAHWQGEMVRLWLFGNGTPGYLGVLIPDGSGQGVLRKKFSLADFSRLPNPPAYCATEEIRRQEPEVKPETQTLPPPGEHDRIWYAAEDGTLTCVEGNRRYIAFPADRVQLPRGGQFILRTIEGRQYVIFPG